VRRTDEKIKSSAKALMVGNGHAKNVIKDYKKQKKNARIFLHRDRFLGVDRPSEVAVSYVD
jgi:hypothetical protein